MGLWNFEVENLDVRNPFSQPPLPSHMTEARTICLEGGLCCRGMRSLNHFTHQLMRASLIGPFSSSWLSLLAKWLENKGNNEDWSKTSSRRASQFLSCRYGIVAWQLLNIGDSPSCGFLCYMCRFETGWALCEKPLCPQFRVFHWQPFAA